MLNVEKVKSRHDSRCLASRTEESDDLAAERRFWVAVNIDPSGAHGAISIPRLKEAGAQGIVEYPLNKIVM